MKESCEIKSENMVENEIGVDLEERKKVPITTILAFLLASICTAIVLEFLITDRSCLKSEFNTGLPDGNTSANNHFKYATFPPIKPKDCHLQHVVGILQEIGYEETAIDDTNWTLLWAHEYPFRSLSERMRNLLPSQTVNHFPGIGFITSKVDLSTSALPFMPKAFRLPEQRNEFEKYSQGKPNSLFVEKHNNHRSISIRPPSAVNLSSTDSFIQEFVDNPFLVDGYKFDIGVYVVLTSINPLMVYMYSGDVLFRYCPEKYYPFDTENVDKYVVGDNYLATWDVPSLKKYFDTFGGSMRAAFDAYVRDQSLDPSVIWIQVEDIIRQTIFSKLNNIIMAMRPFKKGNFFELLRFDLILDDNLQVYLMEVNMSPNLSSAHFKPNALLYEQILYNVFNLVGVGSSLKTVKTSLFNEDIITSDKNIAVKLNDCAKNMCHRSCNKPECDLCLPCLKASEVDILRKAHYEYLHKIEMKRIFPKTMISSADFNLEAEIRNLSTMDSRLTRWFYEKCKAEPSWC
ncbi:tubulin polyglutamylase TTLL6 [Ceratitis capitata]|nr:tubulin polyglutamylase TTLL6 [Ceratitis capitata]XP_012156654.1 tubulin polyglutamylase TTLL6 [Ceratitis capitata]